MKNKNHKRWVNLLKGMMEGLKSYVKDNHMTGLRWNAAKFGKKKTNTSSPDAVFDDIKSSSWKGKLILGTNLLNSQFSLIA